MKSVKRKINPPAYWSKIVGDKAIIMVWLKVSNKLPILTPLIKSSLDEDSKV